MLIAVKYLPRWFPGANFHGVAELGRRISHSFRYDAYTMTKRKLVGLPRLLFIMSLNDLIDAQSEGTAKECMTTILISENTNEDGSVNDEQTFSDAAATAYLGVFLCIERYSG